MSKSFLDYDGLAYLVTKFKDMISAEVTGVGGPLVGDATGDGSTYTATIDGITALEKGLLIVIIPDTTSAATIPTLNLNGLGTKNIKQRIATNTSLTVEAATESWMVANKPVLLQYDGSVWVAIPGRPAASALYGSVSVENGGVPEATASDNGKFLRVVNGTAAWDESKSDIELNFTVVGGSVEPSDPIENTIWVNTDTTITKTTLSPYEPSSPVEGMVWILTGSSSLVRYASLKSNGISFASVNPVAAKQYVSGAWADVTAKIYQGGEWCDWWNGELYDSGNEYGGWSCVPMGYSSGYPSMADPAITREGTSVRVSMASLHTGGAYVYDDPVDITRFSTLELDGNFSSGITGYPISTSLCVWTELGTYVTDNLVASVQYGAESLSVDVSAISGNVRIGLFVWSTNSTITMNSLKLK